MRKLLGTSKTSTDNKITIVELAAEKLNIKKGDLIAFYQENDKISIEKA